MSLNKIIRLGKATPEARRVAVTHPALHVGRRDTTWHSGTLNVDIDPDETNPDVLWVVSSFGSYAYHQDTQANIQINGDWTTPETIYRNFLRLFSVRKECDKIFATPSDYEIYIDRVKLTLQTDATQTSNWTPKFWAQQWGEGGGDYYVVTLSAIERGTTSFSVEVRSSNEAQIKDIVALRIYDLKRRQWIVEGLLVCNPQYVSVQFVTGLVPALNFDFYTYKGKKAQGIDAGDIRAKRVGAKYFADYIYLLP